MADWCVHCRGREATRKGLCPVCWSDRSVRGKRLSQLRSPGDVDRFAEIGREAARRGRGEKTGEPSDDEIDAACEAMLAENPLYRPCPFHPADPRYNAVVAEREAAGLPARHPGDRAGSLE